MLKRLLARFPHFTINGCLNPTPLLTRYKLLRTRHGNLYLHVFHRSDEDRELHDHPWAFASLILWGGYIEHTPQGTSRKWPGMLLLRPATWRHRVDLVGTGRAATLVWVMPKSRDWGFWSVDGTWISQPEYHRAKGCFGEAE